MRFYFAQCFLTLIQFCFLPGNSYGQLFNNSTPPTAAPLWGIDFALLTEPVHRDLSNLNFTFAKHMQAQSRISLSVDEGKLKLAATHQAFGFMVKKDLNVTGVEWFEIAWGVEAYPSDADWQNGKRFEPLMVILFFGDTVSSKLPFLPDVPPFIGMFLGQKEVPLQLYLSSSYPDTGRYVCLGNPVPGQTITSRINLKEVFSDCFDGRDMPPITGIAIEVDTGDLNGGAISSAFIKKLSFSKSQ